MMEFVLYHDRDYVSVRGEGAPYTLMDRASAEMIVDAEFFIFNDGTTTRDLELRQGTCGITQQS